MPLDSPKDAGLDGRSFSRLDDYLVVRLRSCRRQVLVPDETIPVVHPQFRHRLGR